MSAVNELNELRVREHRARQEANRLRREVYQQTNPAASEQLLLQLQAAEKALAEVEQKRAPAQAADAQSNGLILNSRKTSTLLGPQTTGLDAQIYLRMAQLPTSICHLLKSDETPLVTCRVDNQSNQVRRLRVTSFIEGYSAQAVDTVELGTEDPQEFKQLPTLFPDRVQEVNELTRATLNVLIEDLDVQAGPFNGRVELHKSKPIWLLARTTAPMTVIDPNTGQSIDMTRYLGAFVTPNAPGVMEFLGEAAALAPATGFVGYQGNKNDEAIVRLQVEALFKALKEKAEIKYVNSVIANSPEEGSTNQRVRLPSESLKTNQANCIDGTVLVASLLEAISMNPAIVIVPGHAFVGWETWQETNQWKYLETTMINTNNFEEACQAAESLIKSYSELEAMIGVKKVRQWSLQELRGVHRITPMA